MIVIVDYEMGNLRSVEKALEEVGAKVRVTQDPAVVAQADKIVLPGQGAFCDARKALDQLHLTPAVAAHLEQGKPYLGICLGMQLLMETSFEDGTWEGLGFFAGTVERFPKDIGLKVPQIGWNTVNFERADCPIFKNIEDRSYCYFAHSYRVKPKDQSVIAASTDYGEHVASVLWREHVMATQFHPEKSQTVGLQMLKNFVAL